MLEPTISEMSVGGGGDIGSNACTPVLSIITVTFNAEIEISSTQKSIEFQTFRRFEWIIVDGGSSDATVAVLSSESYDFPMRIISEHDDGIYDAMNKGVALSSGEYLMFLNAGDCLFDPHVLENIFSRPPCEDVLYAPVALAENGRIKKITSVPDSLTWESMKNGMVVSHQGLVVSRNCCVLYDTNYKYTSDLDWCIRVLKRARNTYKYSFPLAVYQLGGFSDKHYMECWRNNWAILRRHYSVRCVVAQVPRFVIQTARRFAKMILGKV